MSAITVPTEEEIRAVAGTMHRIPRWRFSHWCRGGDNLLEVGNRVLCKVPMKFELEQAAGHAVVVCNGVHWMLDEIDRLRAKP